MSKGNFTCEKMIEICEKKLRDNPQLFYKESFIANEDYMSDNPNTYRSEVIAKVVNKNIEKLRSIRFITRQASYKVVNHNAEITLTNQEEKNLAKILLKQSKIKNGFDLIGAIEDYEVPLKNSNADIGIGKIDLLAINEADKVVYILELKKKDSKETMLRCVLEAYTYSKIVDKDKLFKDFNIPSDYKLLPAPLVFKDKFQYQQMAEADTKRSELKKLIKSLEIQIFYIEGPLDNGLYQIVK
ncbi:hypothetical protein SAMN04487829_1380 [Pseudobutyrivibrio sp. NOR37]|uniref:Uncharacterized protein n=1 Tax=Pseudobutyrivibrio xylanivorans TaxID=185007 RepID=A0A6M0LGU0_PSEXY|nr:MULTISPECIES: hypothetical protein [Pseudobutyrivibrio]NEX01774.1 hypothetical protein [Pseudobutyrivibrio xylanivorans]SFR71613.1 hypothetical protein SAMN04487829_1380 [Pseudobutyrivibrio sp. NOR37]